MNATDVPQLALPPHSIEAEQAVLGALLLDNAAWPRARELLGEEHFYRADHRRIWRAMAALLTAGLRADVITVAERLRDDGEIDREAAARLLHELAHATPGASNIQGYAQIVSARALQREFAALGVMLQDAAMRPGADVDELHELAVQRLEAVRARRAGGTRVLDLDALAAREPPHIEPICEGIFPGTGTLLSAHGGAGKSTIALCLAVCIAAGHDFFGLPVARRRVRYLSCEDRGDRLHQRLWRICAHLGVDLASLKGWLEVEDLAGLDMILWRWDPRTGGVLTAAYQQLAARIRARRTEVLFVDGISDTYAGSENDRFQPKQYVNALLRLVPADRGAVVIIGHVDKNTARSGSTTTEGYSGSTAWHNAVRGRWYLHHETRDGDDAGERERTGELLLELQKAQYSAAGGLTMRLRWDDAAHLYVGKVIGGASRFERKVQDEHEKTAILRALKACADGAPPVLVPAALSGSRNAHSVLSARPDFPRELAGRSGAKRFRRHLEELRQMALLCECEKRRENRHKTLCLELTAEGLRQCVAL